MRRPLALVGALLLLLTALAACTERDVPVGGSGSVGPLPAAEELLASAAAELGTIKTARFVIVTDDGVDTLGIRSANGVITADGDAEGSAQLDQGGTLVELSFVVKGGSLHVKGLTGGWQQLPLSLAASVYDPSAMLDPERGVANLARTTTGTTEGRERLDDVDTYRIKAQLSGTALAALVPGISGDVTGTLWIGADRPLLHKVSFPAPDQTGDVTVTFSEFDAPVTISAP